VSRLHIDKATGSSTIQYDKGSRRTSLKIPLSTTNKYVTSTYGYDYANRLTSMLLQGASATIENLTYAYDANGNQKSFTRNAIQTLSPAVSSTNHDAANEMLVLGAKNFTNDANGNLQTRSDTCGTTTYTWDARNRLTGISGFKPDCTSLSASFSYDAVNRRISKTINGTTTQFVYDGWDITQEIKAGVKTNYIRTLNIDEPLSRVSSTTTRHYVADALGSTVVLADDTGVTKTTYTYDAFGNATVTGETSDNPFQYTGRENDGTGLYYYRARYYSQEMQRFISEDPIRLNGGINFFSYVQNSPINFTDPSGLFVPQLIGAAINLGFEGYSQYQSGNFNAGRLLVAGATGALGGFGSTLSRAMLFGALSNVLNTAYQQSSNTCKSFDKNKLAKSAALGLAGGTIGYAGGAIGRNIYWPSAVIGREVGQTSPLPFGAHGAAIGVSLGGYVANQ